MSVLDIQTLTRRIREKALNLGFFQAGFAPATALPEEERLRTWLEKGFHGEMRYMERQALKRANPSLVLDNARSLVIVGLDYYQDRVPGDLPLTGRISRYAWGCDYHAIVKSRLDHLLEFICSLVPGARGRSYVDTGPVMEKVWGAETSLGWMGKHTNLIARGHGSWFFLGVILLDIPLEYDGKAREYCGTCARCIQVCPTKAIVAPYVLDARRCISYLTVEFRGTIPRAMRALIGNRIYGCDDCQDACPWNHCATVASMGDLALREENLMPALMPLVFLSHEEFDHRFMDSPIRRITRDGFVRNVVIALGNSSRIESLPAIEAALRDCSPLVRAHAAWALSRLPVSNLRAILEPVRARETDATVLEEIASVLETA